jgi:hypothetical protein
MGTNMLEESVNFIFREMERAYWYKVYKITQCHIPEDYNIDTVGFEVLTAVTIKGTAFWVVTPLVCTTQHYSPHHNLCTTMRASNLIRHILSLI